jgi:phosphopentomutase
MDGAVGGLLAEVDLTDPATLLIALADHGGGGAVPNHHNSEHPLDRTIPLMLAGGAVHRGELAQGASLLDVPATICWALGVSRPESYAGTPLIAAFTRTTVEAAA